MRPLIHQNAPTPVAPGSAEIAPVADTRASVITTGQIDILRKTDLSNVIVGSVKPFKGFTF